MSKKPKEVGVATGSGRNRSITFRLISKMLAVFAKIAVSEFAVFTLIHYCSTKTRNSNCVIRFELNLAHPNLHRVLLVRRVSSWLINRVP